MPLVDDTIIYKGGKVEKLKLTKDINGFQMQEEIEGKVETPTEIAAKIISLTSAQPNGEDGTLLNKKYAANIFYFKKDERLFYVGVRWRADYEEWYCYCYGANGSTWGAGNCVFTTATETQNSEA